ncbi:MAG TPA: GNAT family N-acetyltransferase [Candidatus Eisenbacteria bacterium]|jgi:GNAT superfamily N-acetyltransferase
MRAERVGSVDVLMMTAADILMFNRAAGLGVETPATEGQLDEVIARFHAARVPRFFIDVSPAARPLLLTDWIASRGFSLRNNWVKLTREVEPVPWALPDPRIKEIGVEHADEFARIIQGAFGLPERIGHWMRLLVGRPRRRHFMAFDRDKPIGTAGLYIEGEWASFGYAAVIPEARGRGVQAALIATRIRAARDAGCRWLSMETAEETLEKPSYSLRNARKMGFEVAYMRPNYIGTTA